MYAIRSYYDVEYIAIVDREFNELEIVEPKNTIRITSYNVCYTKLLRV